MDFSRACPSGNVMVDIDDNCPRDYSEHVCESCGGENGKHRCVWCLDKISEEQCIKGEGCCKECYTEHYESAR